MFDILLDGSLKHEHVSAIEGAPDGLSEGTPTSEAKIKGVIEVTIAFHMNIHIVLQKSAHNNSMNDELEEALYVSLEGFSLKRLQNNCCFLLMNLVLK